MVWQELAGVVLKTKVMAHNTYEIALFDVSLKIYFTLAQTYGTLSLVWLLLVL